MNYKTTLYTYNQFLKENGTDKLTKFEKIYSGDPLPYNISNLNEIFNSEINKLEYQVESIKNLKYPEELDYIYRFESKNNNKYRLDLVIIKEDNPLKDIRLHNKIFISVSFSISDATEENYDDETNFYESYDLMNRIKYLIDIHKTKIDENKYIFMFGQPERNDKTEFYRYFIKICFPDYILIKDKTSGFPKTDIGFYLLKNGF